MAHPTQPDVGEAAERDLTLHELRAEFPHLHISSEIYGHHMRVWVARAPGGHPWLVASDDLDRFRHTVQES